MLAEPLALAPSDTNLDYTIEEIDNHLTNISNVIAYSRKRDKIKCFTRCDDWLDRRLMLMALNGVHNGA
jgi:hypothetical protein